MTLFINWNLKIRFQIRNACDEVLHVLSEACNAIKELCEVASLAMASSMHSDEDDFDRVPCHGQAMKASMLLDGSRLKQSPESSFTNLRKKREFEKGRKLKREEEEILVFIIRMTLVSAWFNFYRHG